MNAEKCGVAGIVFSQDRTMVLLIKRRDIPVWALPGGGVDPGESPENAVVREIQEETGLNARIIRLAAVYTPINKLAKTTFIYECERVTGELSRSNETLGAQFFSLTDLPPSFFFIHQEWVLEAIDVRKETIYKALTQVTYWNLLKYFLRHPIHVFRMALARCGIPYNDVR